VVPGAFVWDLTWSLVRLYVILRGVVPSAFVCDLTWSLVRLYGILCGPLCVCMRSYVVPCAFV